MEQHCSIEMTSVFLVRKILVFGQQFYRFWSAILSLFVNSFIDFGHQFEPRIISFNIKITAFGQQVYCFWSTILSLLVSTFNSSSEFFLIGNIISVSKIIPFGQQVYRFYTAKLFSLKKFPSSRTKCSYTTKTKCYKPFSQNKKLNLLTKSNNFADQKYKNLLRPVR